MSKSFKIEGNTIKLIQTTEIDMFLFSDILSYLLKNRIIEFRGGLEETKNGFKYEDLCKLEQFGLVKDVEDAWHMSFVLADDSEHIVDMLSRELNLSKLINGED